MNLHKCKWCQVDLFGCWNMYAGNSGHSCKAFILCIIFANCRMVTKARMDTETNTILDEKFDCAMLNKISCLPSVRFYITSKFSYFISARICPSYMFKYADSPTWEVQRSTGKFWNQDLTAISAAYTDIALT